MNFKTVSLKDIGNIWLLMRELYYDNLVDALIHGYHGEIFTDSLEKPDVALGKIGWNYYLAGNPQGKSVPELLNIINTGEIHANKKWEPVLKNHFKDTFNIKTRYHFSHESLDIKHLEKLSKDLDSKYRIKQIDETLYHQIIKDQWAIDFVGNFKNYQDFKENGLGFVILYQEKIIAGTSSYIYFNGGYEIEIITHPDYRKLGLGSISAAYFIQTVLKQNKIPHWDAGNLTSKRLAERLGYTFKHEYLVYEV